MCAFAIPSFAGDNPYVLKWKPCPGGESYLVCWHFCASCDCNASEQTLCGGGSDVAIIQ